jgi:hypothetical protein
MRTLAGMTEKHYLARVDDVVVRLREMADDVERQGHRTTNHVGVPGFGWSAHSVVHAVMWGMANLSLDSLVVAAADADAAAAEERNEPADVSGQRGMR